MGDPHQPGELFGDLRAVQTAHLPETASAWERLSLTEGHIADQVRTALQCWWAAMPSAAREETRGRLREKNLGAHLGAFWEIYLHQLFTGSGFDVEVDIGSDHDKGNRRPDFRVEKHGTSFGMEATVVLGEDAVERTARARVQQLYAAIQRIRNREFLLSLDLRAVGPRTPGARLVNLLDRWLDTLDVGVERQRREADQDAPATVISHAGWELRVLAHPLRPDLVGRSDLRVIGTKREGWQQHRLVGQSAVEFEGFKKFDEVGPLTKGLRSKAGHGYDLNGEPFVVAVLCGGLFADDREIAQALLGSIEYALPSGHGTWQGGGLWLDEAGRPRNTRVSAVLAVSGLQPSSAAVIEPRLWTNPWAQRPLPADALSWRRFDIQADGAIVEVDASTKVAASLGLPDRWPG